MTPQPRELPPVAHAVDATLSRLDQTLNLLFYLSPLDHEQLFDDFVASGYRNMGRFRYRELQIDLAAAESELFELPVADVEHEALQNLLADKQRELYGHVSLLHHREQEGFRPLSERLFGAASEPLLSEARRILSRVPVSEDEPLDADAQSVLDAANEEIDYYRSKERDFAPEIFVGVDGNASLMVDQGDLYIASDFRLPATRVRGLMGHEIGTHSLTWYNGCLQPMHLLSTGLAGYDKLQEGLGVLAEYLCGCLSAGRLRIIAARVIATDMVSRACRVEEIFAAMHEDLHISVEQSFDIAVRACRGGGFSKDVVYLAGMLELLAYLNDDPDLELLFIGKFDLSQIPALEELMQAGFVLPPRLMPRHLCNEEGREKLHALRGKRIEDLYQ